MPRQMKKPQKEAADSTQAGERRPPDERSVRPKTEVVNGVQDAVHNLLFIKGRLPLLKALVRELERMEQGRALRVRNDAVLRLARDSFEMVVIDLASLREGVTGKRGVLNRLRDHLDVLRPFSPDDADLGPMNYSGESMLSTEQEAAFIAEMNARRANTWNESFNRLFPRGAPVEEAHVADLVARFRADTMKTHQDRNRVRAHRYENVPEDGNRYFQTLAQVEAQFEVMERYFNDLSLVLAKTTYSMNPLMNAHPESTAFDLADLILLGSINTAVVHYGVIGGDVIEGEPPLYWYRRSEFFARGGSIPEDISATAHAMATMAIGSRNP